MYAGPDVSAFVRRFLACNISISVHFFRLSFVPGPPLPRKCTVSAYRFLHQVNSDPLNMGCEGALEMSHATFSS